MKMRKVEILSDLLAMLMLLFITVVPHHHHLAMICLVQEDCLEDHCVNDEHTMHADADSEVLNSLCVANEGYYPEDELLLDWPTPVAIHLATFPNAGLKAISSFPLPLSAVLTFHTPPVLTWRINC